MCRERADTAQHEASAAETNDLVPVEEYVQKMKKAADAEISLMTCKWYVELKTTSENEAKKLRTLREKEEERVNRPIAGVGRKFGPKVGKKAAKRAKIAQLKRINDYTARIKKATAVIAMASQEINRLAAPSP